MKIKLRSLGQDLNLDLPDVDEVEIQIPQGSRLPPLAINVNNEMATVQNLNNRDFLGQLDYFNLTQEARNLTP